MGSMPGARESAPRPYVDERLVEPETREDIVRSRRVQVMPADPEHGDRHHQINHVLGTYVAPGFVGSTGLLTRAGACSDFATDTCIRRAGIDPRTTSRYLEEVAFEVVTEQSMAPHMVARAKELTRCGVRRLIAIFVKKNEVCEWSASKGQWVALDPEDSIRDRTLICPVRVRALLDAAEADDSVVRALKAKGNSVIAEVRASGVAEGRREAIEAVCEVLGISLGPAKRLQLDELDEAGLTTLLERITTNRRWP